MNPAEDGLRKKSYQVLPKKSDEQSQALAEKVSLLLITVFPLIA